MYYGPALRGEPMMQLPGPAPIPAESPGSSDFVSILGVLLRRRRIFIAIFLSFVSAVLLWTLVAPKSYTSTVKLIAGASSPGAIGRSADTTLPLLNALLAAANGGKSAETYVELVQEQPVVLQVIRDLHLHIGVVKLLKQIDVTPVTNTEVIGLSATWSDPDTAAKIANDFANVFVSRERDLIAGQAGSALDFLTKQLPVAEAAMHKADNALAQFQIAHPNVYIGNSGSNQGVDTAVFAAQQKFAQLQVDQGQAKAQLSNVTAQMSSMSPNSSGGSNIVQNPVTAQLQTQLAQVEVQLDSARKQYTEQHPTVQALKEQKAQIEREIRSQPATVVAGNTVVPNPVYQQLSQQAASLRAQIAGAQAQIQTLNAELGRLNGSTNSLPAATVQLANLQRKAKLAEDVYTALQQKYGEATIERTTALSDVAVTQPAVPRFAKVKPDLLLNSIIAVALGLILAVSGVFVVEFFDNTFKDEEDVQRALPLPVLTSVPQLTTKPKSRLPWLRALTVESFLQLVTALRYSSDKPLRSLAITSPNQGDGKSTIALSTAIAMAEMEPKVVLVDADLRRPTLHERLGLRNDQGMSDYLVSAARISDILQPTKYDGLSLISSGVRVPNPIKLLQSRRLDEFITELLQEHRAVVFDTPALQPVFDAAVLGSKVDGTVLVVAAGMTDMPSTKRALQRLSGIPGVNMLGIVLNRVTPTNGYRAYYLTTESPMPLPSESEVVES